MRCMRLVKIRSILNEQVSKRVNSLKRDKRKEAQNMKYRFFVVFVIV